jgi:hypothetical protein
MKKPPEGSFGVYMVARGGIEPPTQGFSTPLLDSTSLFSQKVHPTIGKLCAQNFLGCLYGVDLVELF